MIQKKLILTVGLPRSGKSTWAQQHGAPVVNPDSIRLAMHGSAFIASAEPFVWAIAYAMADALFIAGHETVIVDATNTTKKRRDEWRYKFNKKATVEFVCFNATEAVCRDRAVATDKENLLPVIDRMGQSFEPVDEKEGPCISV